MPVLGKKRSLLAAFWFRFKLKVLSHGGTAQTLRGGRPRGAGGFVPCLSRPRSGHHERERRDPGGNAGAARLGGPLAGSLANAEYQLSPTQLVARRSKAAPTPLAPSVQVKSPPPHGSGNTEAQVRFETNRHTQHTTRPSSFRCKLAVKNSL